MQTAKSLLLIMTSVSFLFVTEAAAQKPQPSQIRVVASDAISWTVEVTDPDGVAWVDMDYGHLPFLFKWRELVSGCPKTANVRVQKKRRFIIRSLPFYDGQVIDCSSNAKAEFVVTTFRITPKGGIKVMQVHRRTFDQQVLLDSADLMILHHETVRTYLKIIIILLLMILFLLLWTRWRALGPFFKERE